MSHNSLPAFSITLCPSNQPSIDDIIACQRVRTLKCYKVAIANTHNTKLYLTPCLENYTLENTYAEVEVIGNYLMRGNSIICNELKIIRSMSYEEYGKLICSKN